MEARKWIPWMMVAWRVVLGPVVITGERCRGRDLALAWRVRVRWLRERVEASAAAAVLGVIFVLAMGGKEAQAQSLQHVIYVGGTALQSRGIHGSISVSSADTLEFLGPSKLVIPYEHVISYESKNLKKVHVGLLTEAVWRLIAPWPEAKLLSLSYRDTDEHSQVVVLEMSKGDEALLVEVLKTRVPRGAASQPVPLMRPPIIGRDKLAER